MKTIEQFRSKLRMTAAQMREIYDKAESESRGLTNEEKVEWERLRFVGGGGC